MHIQNNRGSPPSHSILDTLGIKLIQTESLEEHPGFLSLNRMGNRNCASCGVFLVQENIPHH